MGYNARAMALLAAGTIFSSISPTSLANDSKPGDEQITEFSTVVVSATRKNESLEDSTRSISVVDKAAIEQQQASSVPALLDAMPNVSVSGGPRSGHQSINIRGLEDNRVLQLIDGARQEFESGHRPSYYLNPEFVRSVEAIKGPASALWGSGAIGGVVAQRTIDPADILRGDQDVGGFIKGQYNDNNHLKSGTAVVAGRGESTDWLFGGYHNDHQDIEVANDTDLGNSAERNYGAMAKMIWYLDDHQQLTLTARDANTFSAVPTNGTTVLNGTSNFLINRDQHTQNLSLAYRQEDERNASNTTNALLYWNAIDMDEYRLSDLRSDSTQLDVYGFNLNRLQQWGEFELLLGIDGYREEFDAQRGGTNRPEPPTASNDVYGVFADLTRPLNDAVSVSLGIRYDAFRTKADNLNTDRSDSAASPSAAITWQANDWAQFTLRHDQAFRAPSAEELYTTGTHFCLGPMFCNTFVSNPDLKPEEAANNELLARFNWNNLFGDDELQLSSAIFQNKVDNFIEQVVSDPVFFPVADAGTTSWFNVDEATLDGFEIEANYRIQNLQIGVGYGQTRGEDDDSGNDLTNIPADTLSANISYAFLGQQLSTGVRVLHADRQAKTDYPENTTNTTYAGYTVTDLYASFTPARMPALTVDLVVNNVNDRDYRRAWSELDSAGREIISSIRYAF